MLCRRCGLESSTTDVCEWCNRPMLPAGASVSGKAAKELKQSGRPLAAAPPPSSGIEPQGDLLIQQEATDDAEIAEAAAHAPDPDPDVTLRPLGHGQATEIAAPAQAPPAPTQQRSGPSHGLSDDTMRTSIDVSQYMGADQTIFKPIQKEDGFASAASMDRVTGKKKIFESTGPNWTENERLMRCAVTGMAISMIITLAQFAVTHKTVDKMFSAIPLGYADSFVTALKFGVLLGLALGFMLGALLVKTQKGPGAGMLLGMLLGFSAGGAFNLFNVLAGAVAGIMVGRFATLGIRRVINV